MTAEKFRLKFRVSALKEPRWSEKWGVGLFDYEEFHVTDQLLKLPFQEATPKAVCVFSVATGVLAFRLTDPDRRADVNGITRREAIVGVGDKIKIGEALLIEVLTAPPKVKGERSSAVLDPRLEEGPTLTHASTLSEKPESIAPQAPIFSALKTDSLEIDEPSFHPKAQPRSVPTPPAVRPTEVVPPRRGSILPEEKVELANVAHARRDDSLENKTPTGGKSLAEMEDEEIDYSGRLTFVERIKLGFALIFREKDGDKKNMPSPWLTPDRVDPGITKMKTAAYGKGGVKSSPTPWIPEAISAAARIRGRALIFLVAAIGALMIAVGVFRIQSRVAELEANRQKQAERPGEMSRGIPIDVIEEKVRRMRRPR